MADLISNGWGMLLAALAVVAYSTWLTRPRSRRRRPDVIKGQVWELNGVGRVMVTEVDRFLPLYPADVRFRRLGPGRELDMITIAKFRRNARPCSGDEVTDGE